MSTLDDILGLPTDRGYIQPDTYELSMKGGKSYLSVTHSTFSEVVEVGDYQTVEVSAGMGADLESALFIVDEIDGNTVKLEERDYSELIEHEG